MSVIPVIVSNKRAGTSHGGGEMHVLQRSKNIRIGSISLSVGGRMETEASDQGARNCQSVLEPKPHSPSPSSRYLQHVSTLTPYFALSFALSDHTMRLQNLIIAFLSLAALAAALPLSSRATPNDLKRGNGGSADWRKRGNGADW
ncbi:uncharacterized protein FOMMEDRAFT_164692 [Fomitiporia mediterranea MF3/22]|uniref:uncharacterized protein n=1 Tax=Fomitiporia mediterranea (strain MF3/22) TaxID=694068 RepID=UPI0004407DF0|nr:uncharacterized protein FOMMEDRAFT_164692 [Fomitiporia mediterranea MF3/22]EJD07830.1 hypothetical protein FOMMEDRAFT_164692 [Fomitiporia mediterranea MF3/22]